MSFDLAWQGAYAMLANAVSNLRLIEILSEKVPAWALRGLQGSYHWQLESGVHLGCMEVSETLSWSFAAQEYQPRATIVLSDMTLQALANKVDDPLTLFNTGKLLISADNDHSAISVDVMKLLNFIFNNALVDTQRIAQLGIRSTQGKDFPFCQVIADERDIEPYLRRGEPVIVRNAAVSWPIFSMPVGHIVNRVGNLDVSLLLEEYDLENAQPPKYRKTSFAEYVESLYAVQASASGYMAANTVPPALDDTYCFPSVFAREVFNTPRWWIGPASTGLRLHRDMVDNFLVQLKGRKKIRLFAPSETKFLYPASVGGNLMYEPSRVDPENYLAEKFPDYQQSVSTVCELRPGDMLYLPAGWWHHVLNLEVSWSLNFFAVNGEPRVLSVNRDNYESVQL
ncbi:cupin-like domain-containing protein [Pseudomonas protegens]|uniref:cupin-like domain-containing protein n=1 Tax=Pseudomonas protegens TaxID=380021 RepID=UPI0009C124D2|nr:cupin-like domain-containing protein [Pseudomonas protegens]MDX9680051.1 cupin-like domain-containing protein [Pseudomonas protegens]